MAKDNHRTFNRFYQAPDYYYGLDLRPEFTEFFADKDLTGATALDLGCGEGRYTLYLAQKGCHVTAVDISRAGLDKLGKAAWKERLPVTIRAADVAGLAFSDQTCDIIVAATILDHLEKKARTKTIAGIRSALKPGGILYANVFTVEDPGYRRQRKNSAESEPGVSDTAGFMAYYFASEELRQLFGDWSIHYYYEGLEPDHSHGRPHAHGWACLLAEKPYS